MAKVYPVMHILQSFQEQKLSWVTLEKIGDSLCSSGITSAFNLPQLVRFEALGLGVIETPSLGRWMYTGEEEILCLCSPIPMYSH